MYSIDLKTGNSIAGGFTLKPGINDLYLPNDSSTFYYHNLKKKEILAICNPTSISVRHSRLSTYSYFRVSLNQPEKLFLFSLQALPRPYPYIVHKLLQQYKNTVPLNKIL